MLLQKCLDSTKIEGSFFKLVSKCLLLRILLVMSYFLSLTTGDSVSQRPHIIFILADDLGWNDVSFNGSPQIPTPNLDALASDGIVLHNHYVQPSCTPSRAALLTGLYPIRTGMQHFVLLNEEARGLPLSVKLLPEKLKELGYRTYMVGKWHLGFYKREYTPTQRGFDHFSGYYGAYIDYYKHYKYFLNQTTNRGFDLRRNFTFWKEVQGKYLTGVLASEVRRFIERHDASQPFFLYYSHMAPHSANSDDPFQAPKEYTKRFSSIGDKNRTIYAGMVAALDETVGDLMLALEKRNMLKNSIIVFASDNGGECIGSNQNRASNAPLRGMKYTLFDGGIKTPSFIWSPLLKKANGRVSRELIHITDWLPTLFDAAGGRMEDVCQTDGVNQWRSLLENVPSPRKEILLNIDHTDMVFGIRMGDYKLLVGTSENGTLDKWFPVPGKTKIKRSQLRLKKICSRSSSAKVLRRLRGNFDCKIRKGVFKTKIKCPKDGCSSDSCDLTKAPCLFDLSKDPCEHCNIASTHPEMVALLLEKINKYNATSIPPSNIPVDLDSDPKLHGNAWVSWHSLPATN